MILFTNNKTTIDLNDYLYKMDIHRRRCVVQFTPFERDLFYEMVLGSIETTIEDLADDLDVDPAIVLSILKKNKEIGLYSLEECKVVVHKEERKLFEIELEKFNDSFYPNLNYIKVLFNKVPIDLLPRWFALSKGCDAIFPSIVDKHFASPKLFERYVQEFEFDDPLMNKIVKELYTSAYYSINLQDLKANHYLSDELLYQVVAILEFNLLAVHSFQKIGNDYFEVITPPYEYRMLLIDKLEKRPKSIREDETSIEVYTLHKDYIPKVTKTLKTIDQLTSGKNPDVHHEDLQIIKRLLEIDLLDTLDEEVVLSNHGKSFLNLPEEEKALHFLRTPRKGKKRIFSEWVQRQIERELLTHHDWVFVDEFVSSLHTPLDGHVPLELVRKGRSSFYSTPSYTKEEKEQVRSLLCDFLAVAGVLELGEVEGKLALRVTSFGRNHLT